MLANIIDLWKYRGNYVDPDQNLIWVYTVYRRGFQINLTDDKSRRCFYCDGRFNG